MVSRSAIREATSGTGETTHQSNQSDVENDHRVPQMGSGPRLNEGLCYTNTPPEEAI
jgi:hypothetical protein